MELNSYSGLPNERIKAANGIDYAYRDTGPMDDGAGVPLVLLQHFRGNLDNWAPFDALTCGYLPTCTNAHRLGPYRTVPARIKPFQPAVMFPWEHHTGTANA
ncbi:hypothetical protein ABZW44_45745 [Streptomyces mirabilis]|uniref:hypothetical protein n=1 Tax=Streptomyces mirabilis TaxID=68239 RepID=UPI0033BE1EBD